MVCARARVAWLHGLRARRVVTWFARVSRGYNNGLRACRVVTWFARVSHGLPSPIALNLALPRVAGPASFNVVAFLVIFIVVSLHNNYKEFSVSR